MKKLLSLTLAAVSVAGMLITSGSALAEPQAIVVKGSDTIVNLGQRWAELFMNSNEDFNVSVTGGGSSIGLAALINGTCDIAMASRAIKKKEIDSAKSQGRVPYAIEVALDGLAFVVNEKNPVKALTVQQLGAIYKGEIVDWRQVGGKPGRIVVLTRDNNSGTWGFVKENVLMGAAYRSDALVQPSTKSIQMEVKKNPNAIGYGGVAYFLGKDKGVFILSVSASAGEPAIQPTEENVITKKYPVWRPLRLYTNGKPTGSIKAFIDYILSDAGQKVVREIGYVPLKKVD